MLREPWSLLGVDLFFLQVHLARQSLTLLFISVLCCGCINPGSLQYHQSSEHLWISNLPSPLPSKPPSQEQLNLVYPSLECFISGSDQENGEKSLGRILTSSKLRKLPGTPTCLEFEAYAHQKQDASMFTPKSSTCSSSVHNMPQNFKLSFVVLAL